MTIRVRKGGVYDWEVPGPNTGQDSKVQRRIKPIGGAVTMDSLWDARGRRTVRMSQGGKVVGWVHKNRTWRLKDRPVKGSAKTVSACLAALAGAL